MENYLTLVAVTDTFAAESGFSAAFTSLVANEDWHYADIPSLVARALHELRSPNPWESLDQEAKKSKEGKAKRALAESFKHSSVAQALLADGDESDLLGVMRFVKARI